MFDHVVDTVSVAVQRSQERLRKHTLQLDGIQGTHVLPWRFKRVKRRIIVSRNCKQKTNITSTVQQMVNIWKRYVQEQLDKYLVKAGYT